MAIVATQQQCQAFVRLLQAARRLNEVGRLALIFVALTMAFVMVWQLCCCRCRCRCCAGGWWMMTAMTMAMAMTMTIATSVAFNCSPNVRYGINIVIATNWQLVLPSISILSLLFCLTFAYFNPLLMFAIVNDSRRTCVFSFIQCWQLLLAVEGKCVG